MVHNGALRHAVRARYRLLHSSDRATSMNQGVQAYKNMQYAEAVKHFKEAVELDPDSAERAALFGHVLLWFSGCRASDAPDNLKNYDMAARKTFQDVLDKDPKNSLALASMASMAYNEATAGTPDQKKAALARGQEMESAPH